MYNVIINDACGSYVTWVKTHCTQTLEDIIVLLNQLFSSSFLLIMINFSALSIFLYKCEYGKADSVFVQKFVNQL